MSFLVDPIKDFIQLPYIVLTRKPYCSEDVEEWISTVFKTITTAGFVFAYWSIYKMDAQWEKLLILTGSSCIQYGLHPYTLYLSTSYFTMALGVDCLIKGFPEKHNFLLITGSLGLLSGIAGLYRAKKYKETKLYEDKPPNRYPESLLDYRFHNCARAIVSWKK